VSSRTSCWLCEPTEIAEKSGGMDEGGNDAIVRNCSAAEQKSVKEIPQLSRNRAQLTISGVRTAGHEEHDVNMHQLGCSRFPQVF
jgi:hypothetical protein